MIINPNTLVARVFLVRYGDLQTVGLSSKASFIWMSLVGSRDLVDRGMAWKVGDGSNISVLSDRWIYGVVDPIRDSEVLRLDVSLPVKDLILPDRTWDENKVKALFGPVVQENILRTPIGESGCSDVRVWRFDEKGRFSVKSAYLLDIGFYEPHAHACDWDRKCWSRLVWTVAVPSKTRVFLWRAFNNIIPLTANLKLHHVPCSGICALCGDRWDSTEHRLLYCPKVRRIWKESSFGGLVKRANGLALMDIAEAVRKERGKEDYALWALMLWQVWSYVCKLRQPFAEEAAAVSELGSEAFLEAY